MQHNDMPPGYRITHVLGEPFCTLQQLVYAFFETDGKDDPAKAGPRWVTLSTHESLMDAKAALRKLI